MKIHILGLLCITCLLFGCRKAPVAASLYILHPDDSSKQVEYFVEKPSGKGPWSTVILLHGHQESNRPGGLEFVNWGVLKELAGRGYLAVAISQPGYGNSSGSADFCGPFTQHAVTGVIAKLKSEGQAKGGRILIEGISRGALTAGLVAAHDSSISGIVLISGEYDLPSYIKDPNSSPDKQAVVKALMDEMGASDEALKSRSVMEFAGNIKASALILNGALDDRTEAKRSEQLAEKIIKYGGRARAIIYPEFGHKIPVDVRNRDIDPFIDSVLK